MRGINELIYVKCLEGYLTHSKYYEVFVTIFTSKIIIVAAQLRDSDEQEYV